MRLVWVGLFIAVVGSLVGGGVFPRILQPLAILAIVLGAFSIMLLGPFKSKASSLNVQMRSLSGENLTFVLAVLTFAKFIFDFVLEGTPTNVSALGVLLFIAAAAFLLSFNPTSRNLLGALAIGAFFWELIVQDQDPVRVAWFTAIAISALVAAAFGRLVKG